MSVPVLELLKHADVLSFPVFPKKLEDFFTSEFLSLIGGTEKQNFEVMFTGGIKAAIDDAFKQGDQSLYELCVTDGIVRVLTWGFCTSLGWITLSQGGKFEWAPGYSKETTAAAVIAANAAAAAPTPKRNMLTRGFIGVAKKIAKTRAAKTAAVIHEKFVEYGTWVKDRVELVQFGVEAVTAGAGLIQLYNGDMSGIPVLMTAISSTRRNRVRPNFTPALAISYQQ